MKFQRMQMYKNMYKDPHVAFLVKQIVSNNKNSILLNVDWYQKTEWGKYISLNINQDLELSKEQQLYYVPVS